MNYKICFFHREVRTCLFSNLINTFYGQSEEFSNVEVGVICSCHGVIRGSFGPSLYFVPFHITLSVFKRYNNLEPSAVSLVVILPFEFLFFSKVTNISCKLLPV